MYKDGRTPLHYAASGGDEALCELLLDRGADANVKNKASMIIVTMREVLCMLTTSWERMKQ
jgi:ankyrin repeat protein